jgi:prepilin-type N-terminal cleavage/methylation domain-containing protein
MFIRSAANRRGFTLLEVMIATLVIALMTFGLYRFILSNLNAMQVSTELHDERQSLQGLVRFLQVQLAELPLKRQGALSGAPFKFNNLSSDEMTWVCGAGHGMMTDAAEQNYKVTLALQPEKQGSKVLELGLRREPAGDETEQRLDADFFTRGSGNQRYNWIPLIRGVAAIKIRYFDARLNAMVDRWNDPNARPSIVSFAIWRDMDGLPFEAVLEVPSARLQQQ